MGLGAGGVLIIMSVECPQNYWNINVCVCVLAALTDAGEAAPESSSWAEHTAQLPKPRWVPKQKKKKEKSR